MALIISLGGGVFHLQFITQILKFESILRRLPKESINRSGNVTDEEKLGITFALYTSRFVL